MSAEVKWELKIMAVAVLVMGGVFIALLSGCGTSRTTTRHPDPASSDTWKPTREAQESPLFDTEPGIGIENDPRPIFFDFDSFFLRPDAIPVLVDDTQILRQAGNPIALEGYCDERGTIEYNLALGMRRAGAVRKFLINQGIDPDLLTAVSFGKDRPAAPGHTESAWAKNRRVEVKPAP